MVARSALLVLLLAPLAARAAEPAPEARTWDLSPHEKHYSQGNEELIVRHFFDDRRDGVFLDVGCYHWKQSSTTYYLEEQLGWSGIGVDALPWLRAGYEQNRKATRFFNYLVAEHSGGVETLFVAGPLSSTDESRIEAWHPDGERKAIEVPRISLNDLLDQAEVAKIDFLSMDIEGGEASALAGFDIERFRPALVCIEVAPQNREVVAKYFADHGYELLERYRPYDPVNWYYSPKRASGQAPEPAPGDR